MALQTDVQTDRRYNNISAFSSKSMGIKIECRLLQILLGSLRVKLTKVYQHDLNLHTIYHLMFRHSSR